MNEFAGALALLRKRQEEYLQKARAIQMVIEDLTEQGGAESIEKKKETRKEKAGICQNCGKPVKKFKYCNSKCRQAFFTKRAREKYQSKHRK